MQSIVNFLPKDVRLNRQLERSQNSAWIDSYKALIVAEAYNLNQSGKWVLVLWNPMLWPDLIRPVLNWICFSSPTSIFYAYGSCFLLSSRSYSQRWPITLFYMAHTWRLATWMEHIVGTITWKHQMKSNWNKQQYCTALTAHQYSQVAFHLSILIKVEV